MDHWFADLSDDDEAVEGSPWQPFVQIAGGCFPLPIWFLTEHECQAFIATIPQGSPVTFKGRARANGETSAPATDRPVRSEP
jgi:hypothetical protein